VEVLLHFVAKPGRAEALEAALRARGLGVVRRIGGSERVVVRASAEALRRDLGVAPPGERAPAAPAGLPGEIAELVESWASPPPPVRWHRDP